jgi:hypothetical protein
MNAPSELARACCSACSLEGSPIGLKRARVLMIPPSSLVPTQEWWLIRLRLRALFSPAQPRSRRDAPFSQGAPPYKMIPPSLLVHFNGKGGSVHMCANVFHPPYPRRAETRRVPGEHRPI